MQKNHLHYSIYPFLVQDAMTGRMAEVVEIDLRYVYCPHSFFFLRKENITVIADLYFSSDLSAVRVRV